MDQLRYVIYKTTNSLNGRYYIGQHRTKNINDSYLGSGSIILHAIKKYGKNNFNKIILAECISKDDLDYVENIIVGYHLNDELCYNIKPGGRGGGFPGNNKDKRWFTNGEMNKRINPGDIIPDNMKLGFTRRALPTSDWKNGGNKNKNKEWITNGIDESMVIKSDILPEGWYKGRNNEFEISVKSYAYKGALAHIGKIWITDGIVNKRIHLNDNELPIGWNLGRRPNYKNDIK